MTPVTQPQPDTRLANFVLPQIILQCLRNASEDEAAYVELMHQTSREQPHFTGIGTRRVKDDGN